MRGWKVLAATPLLVVPLAVLGLSIADGPEQKTSTPAMVLPAAAVEGPEVTMRREKVPADEDGRGPQPRPDERQDERQDVIPSGPGNGPQSSPSSSPPQTNPQPDQDCVDHEHESDDNDDGVEFVHPCPGAVGDDEDDDDDDGDD